MPPSEPTSEPTQVTLGLLRGWALPTPTGTKDERGVVLVVGGSRDTVGAVRLAGEAALRVGAGKLQIATARSAAAALGVAMPEALGRPLPEDHDGALDAAAAGELVELAGAADVVLLGPGLVGKHPARTLVEELLPSVRGRLVLDALGMAAVAPGTGRLAAGRGPAVLTPNVRELSISLGREQGDVEADLPDAVRSLVAATGAVVRSGSDRPVVADPDGRAWVEDAAPAGLGVSGSGDVLAGTVAGLLARGAEPAQAAVWASRLHAEAANRVATRVGPVGYLAREVAAELPWALRHVG